MELSANPSISKTHVESSGAPKLAIDETSYDFGEIKPGSKNTATFRFSNAGDSILKITNVKKCCGAVIKLDKQELSPGESGVLTAQYQAGQGASMLNKNIGLFTNDPDNPQTTLTITGKVVPTLKWSPGRFEIAPYNQDASCPEITITSLDDTPFAIKEFNSTNQCFTVDLNPSNKATEFILKPKADLGKLNALDINRGIISIVLDHPDYEAINLKFTVVPPLQVIPAQILVFNAELNELPDDDEKLVVDPMFFAPGTGGEGLSTLGGYKLKLDSPCINTGMLIAGNTDRDFYGNTINDGSTDFGVYEQIGSGAFVSPQIQEELSRLITE